ncbi:MAG: hypothetical protein JNL08_10180 [Planctomycetes bacterium]|nr:hypothetical protein [Planctomycetota bacterium]
MPTVSVAGCVLLGTLSVLASSLPAQCTPAWQPADGYPGANGIVRAATRWDPDGAGPLQPRLVVAGSFTLVGTAAAAHVAVQDPSSGAWSPLGAGPGVGDVQALAVLPNGDLVAGGASVARWDGVSWSLLGAGPGVGTVRALATLPSGDLVAGGTSVVRWDGVSWSSLGLTNPVIALCVLPNGHLVASGSGAWVAEWNGLSWASLPAPVPFGNVRALTALPTGQFVVAGDFLTIGFVGRWDGTTWSTLGTTALGGVLALTTLANGDVVAGGEFTTMQGVGASRVARWNGTSWSALGAGVDGPPWSSPLQPGPGVYALTTLSNGDLVAGGQFTTAGAAGATRIARWDGASWSALAPGTNGAAKVLRVLANGDLLVGGTGDVIGGVAAARVARWDGTVWSPLGAGISAHWVGAAVALANGNVVVGGAFTSAGATAAQNVARWDGTTWTALGAGFGSPVYALAATPNGDLLAGGSFATTGGARAHAVARWNGVAWLELGGGVQSAFSQNTAGVVYCMEVLPGGDVVVGGNFGWAGGSPASNIARWNGSTWSALGAGLDNAVLAVRQMPNGDLLAGGYFANAGGAPASRIARWDGAAWAPLGTGMDQPVLALVALPNGDVVAAGEFTTAGGVAASRIARWNGTAWSPFGAGADGKVEALAVLPDGELVVGGEFTRAGGAVSPFLASLAPTCPALVADYGVGCPSSGGGNLLASDSLPWVDTMWRATGTGLPTTAVVATVTSLTSIPQAVVPLSLVFAQAGLGCDLLVAPDILGLLLTTTGTVQSQHFLHNTPPLVGVTFYHQMVPIDLGPGGAVTATNALQLTAGTF